MNIDPVAVFALFRELYPRELQHVLSELRARQAEDRLAELEAEDSTPPGEGAQSEEERVSPDHY